MPITRRKFNRRIKRRRIPGIVVAPRMYTRTQAAKRRQNISTKVFYIKDNGEIRSDITGAVERIWSAEDIYTSTPANLPQWPLITPLFEQYKVLAMTIKLFPANVGIEPHDAAIGQDFTLFRGNHIVWTDVRPGAASPFPIQIKEIINQGSARMIHPRRGYSRTIYRATGFSPWGSLELPTEADSWKGTINLLVNHASVWNPISQSDAPLLYYWTRTYKVLLRGRRQ